MRKRPFAVLIPAVAAALAIATPAGAATSTSEATSENWAGYVASPSTSTESTSTSGSSGFSAASGSWTEPTVNCSSGSQTYSAFWVGLGGGGENSQALEQEGTQADCSATGTASYYAWYELVPSAPVKIAMTIKPGDKMWARTAVDGDQVTVEVDDKTTGQSFSKTLTMTDATPDTSTAEWVAEAPSECDGGATGQCEPLPLSNFGTVKFTDAYATSGGQTKALSNWSAQAVELDPATGGAYGYGNGYGGGFGSGFSQATESTSSAAGAAPGSVSSDGTTFSVQYGAEASSASTAGAGTSSGYGAGGYGSSSGYGDSGYGTEGYGASSGYGDSSGDGLGGYGYPTGGGGYGYGYGYSDGYGGGGGYGYSGGYGGGDSGYYSEGYGDSAESYGGGDTYGADATGGFIGLF